MKAFITALSLASVVTLISCGCGKSDVPKVTARAGAMGAPGTLKRKLNDMSAADRMAYMKAHPEAMEQLMRGRGGPVPAKGSDTPGGLGGSP